MVRTKVFVGNLSFNVRDNELAKEFELAGKVISANIITRGPRSLGYGFVEMDNESDAENAVKLLDKKEINGRPINVEVAKPREEGASDEAQADAQGAARPRGQRRGSRGPKPNQTGTQTGSQGQSRPQGQSTGAQGGNNGSQYRRRRSDEEGEGRPPRAPRAPRTARPPRAEGEADNRTPSKTTLFVANLPFTLDDVSFAKILKDSSLAYKTAHVVKKKTGRSKGFGFIEFENEADQQKALASLNNKEVESRPLAVKVALTELRSEDLQSSSPAPTKSSSPAPAKAATGSSPAPVKTTTTAAPNKSSSPAPAKATGSPAPAKTSNPSTSSPKQEKK